MIIDWLINWWTENESTTLTINISTSMQKWFMLWFWICSFSVLYHNTWNIFRFCNVWMKKQSKNISLVWENLGWQFVTVFVDFIDRITNRENSLKESIMSFVCSTVRNNSVLHYTCILLKSYGFQGRVESWLSSPSSPQTCPKYTSESSRDAWMARASGESDSSLNNRSASWFDTGIQRSSSDPCLLVDCLIWLPTSSEDGGCRTSVLLISGVAGHDWLIGSPLWW